MLWLDKHTFDKIVYSYVFRYINNKAVKRDFQKYSTTLL